MEPKIFKVFGHLFQYFSILNALCFMSRSFVILCTLYNYTTTFKCRMTMKKKLTKITRLFTYICLWSRNFFVYLLTEVSDHFFLDHLRYKKDRYFSHFRKNEGVSAFCHIDPEINFSGYLSTNSYQ